MQLKTLSKQAHPDRLFPLLFLLFGFTVMSAQILLLRIFLATFSGNELSVGIFLGSWLFWNAAGSYFWGKRVRGAAEPARLMYWLLILGAFGVPVTALAIRFSRLLLYPFPGEMAGFSALGFSAVFLLLPFCFLSGGMFAVGSFLRHRLKKEELSRAASRVYLLETAGSAVGGIGFSVLVLTFDALAIALFLFALNILFALYWAQCMLKVKRFAAAGLLIVVVLFALAALRQGKQLRLAQWPGFDLLAEKDSEYGNYTLIRRQENCTLLENSLPLFTVPDVQTAEENVHYAMLLHPRPASVLLIGGGLGGAITEILKYPSVKNVDYLEMDPALFELTQKYFPTIWKAVRRDRRVTLHQVDGRVYLRNSKNKYDLIILNLPDPLTAQINRFYTKEFFKLAGRKLNREGILSFKASGSENYINQALARYLRCLYATVQSVFPAVAVMPGATIHFFAAKKKGLLLLSAKLFIKRLKERRIQTRYVREYFLPFRLSADRMASLRQVLNIDKRVAINSDFSPRAYYLSSVFWTSHFSGFFTRLLGRMQSIRLCCLAGAMLFVFLLLFFFRLKKMPAAAGASFLAEQTVLASGFTMMSLELLILLAYQALNGSLYYHLALLLGVFMAGMAFGTGLSLRIQKKNGKRLLLWLNLGLACMAFVAVVFIRSASGFSLILSRVLFNLLAGLVGLSGGFVFPVVSRLVYKHGNKRNSGSVYGMDLAGSLTGAFFSAAFIIPVYGFKGLLILILLLHLLLTAEISGFLFLRKKDKKSV